MSAPKEVIPRLAGPCATRSEKLAAFDALTPEQRGRLLKYARYIAMKFSGRVNEADGDDLYQEGLLRALDEKDTRNWHKQGVDFVGFLRGCIQSIGDEWYRKSSVGERGSRKSRYTELPDEIVSPTNHHEQMEAAWLIERMCAALKNRPYAVEIFDLKRRGLKAKEIVKELGIPQNVYAAAVKWIDRTLQREGFRK